MGMTGIFGGLANSYQHAYLSAYAGGSCVTILPPVLSSHHLLFNLFGSVSVAAAEEKGVVFVSFCCIYQCLCDAVRNGFDIAVFQTLEAGLMAGRTPSLICCKNGFKMARPGIPTGLWVITISSFLR